MLRSIWARGNRKFACAAPTGRSSRRNAGRRATWSSYLARRPTSRVIVETCAEAFGVADAATELGHETRVVPATLVKTLGVGARRHEDGSARRSGAERGVVPNRSAVGHIPKPSRESGRRCAGCAMRWWAHERRSINTVRGWLRGQGRRIEREVAAHSTASRDRLAGTAADYVERQLLVIDVLTDADRRGRRRAGELGRGRRDLSRLMTVPGVGPLTALRFVAAIDDVIFTCRPTARARWRSTSSTRRR